MLQAGEFAFLFLIGLSSKHYVVVLKCLKKETVIRYLSLLCGGSSKMCHISFVRHVEMQEGLGSREVREEVTSQGHSCGCYVPVWLQPGKWQWALCMLSKRVYHASLQHITSDI